MLYERWCSTASRWPHEIALRDVSTGRQWTFAELRAAAEARDLDSNKIVHPRGNSPEFIFTLLGAWRSGKIACPLEVGQTAPRTPNPPPNCVHLKTTSATTGTPRLVAFTAAQLAADADNIVATMGLRQDWPNLGVISMAHSYGFSNLVLPLLLHGIPLLLVPSPLPEVIRRAAAVAPALTLAGVPALWRAWSEAGAIPPNIHLAISAGAPLPAGLEKAVIAASGIKIHNFYGSSECGGIAYDATETPRKDGTCVGTPLRNVDLSLNDDGCLQVRSRAVGETYWPEPAPALGAGRFQTSDLTEIKGGVVYLRGRSSDQINIHGRKVSPETVERALSAHPQVRECLVFGAPSRDAERTDMIVAVVAGKATESELKEVLQQKLAPWQVPREWWFVDSLSPNQRGKMSRAEWRQRYLETSQDKSPPPSQEHARKH
jgi:long-chain acyl-CoA synthetase